MREEWAAIVKQVGVCQNPRYVVALVYKDAEQIKISGWLHSCATLAAARRSAYLKTMQSLKPLYVLRGEFVRDTPVTCWVPRRKRTM